MKLIITLLMFLLCVYSSCTLTKRENKSTYKAIIGKWKFSEVKIDKLDNRRFTLNKYYLENQKNEDLLGCSLNGNPNIAFSSDSIMTVFCNDKILTTYYYELRKNEIWLFKSDYVITIPFGVTDKELIFINKEIELRKKTFFKKI